MSTNQVVPNEMLHLLPIQPDDPTFTETGVKLVYQELDFILQQLIRNLREREIEAYQYFSMDLEPTPTITFLNNAIYFFSISRNCSLEVRLIEGSYLEVRSNDSIGFRQLCTTMSEVLELV